MNILESRTVFPEAYKDQLFVTWYNLGKPTVKNLFDYIEPEKFSGAVPTEATVGNWIREIYKPRAELLDKQVVAEIEGRLVKEKIEMMQRHADVAMKMQDIAIEYLSDPEILDKLTPSTTIRLLVEGIQIERESRGLPQAMNKMINKTDEELMKELEGIIDKSASRIEKLDA